MLLSACDDSSDISSTQKITVNGQNIESSPEFFESLASLIKRVSSPSEGVVSKLNTSESNTSRSDKEENAGGARSSAIEECHNKADAVFHKISSLNHDWDIELDKNKFEVKLFSLVKLDKLESISNLKISIDGSNCMVEISLG
jgi:hypothetical protein